MKIAKNARGESIFFDEGKHTYTIEDGAFLVSGTTFLKQFAEEFDSKTISERYAAKHGLNAAEVRKQWKEKGEKAAKFGTNVHFLCEQYVKNEWLPKPIDDKEKLYFDICKPELDKLLEKYEILETEKIIFSQELGVAGTIDLLAKNKKNGKIVLFDYKTNEKITKQNAWNNLKAPVIHLEDCHLNKYSLQLNLYKYIMIQECYFDKNTKFDMQLIHITEKGFEYIKVKDMQFEIENLFKFLKE